ncbi:MAG: response regulator [Sphingobacteriales bacterium]|nr:MAG: response regulator [Sphingobacteriales bacterium]
MQKEAHILIVEDNQGDIVLMTKRFKELGIECCISICRDGSEAKEYLEQQENGKNVNIPDLIILDFNLPKKNGRELLHEIKTNERLMKTPIIVFTSSDDQDDVEDAYAEYANSYVVKPFGLEKYYATIDAIYEFWIRSAKLPSGRPI